MKLAKYISISLFIGIGLISCNKDDNQHLEVPFGTSILVRNGQVLDYLDEILVSQDSLNENSILIGFLGNYTSNSLDVESFSLHFLIGSSNIEIEETLNDSNKFASPNPNSKLNYGIRVDGDQPGYRYNLIQGTAFVDLIVLDTVERIVNIQWGGSFIREDTNGWNLDLPYRADMIGIIHNNY